MRLGTCCLMIVLCILIVLAAFSYVLKDFVEKLCGIEDRETVATALKILKNGKLPSLTDKSLLNTNFSELLEKLNNSTRTVVKRD